jgi:Lar family restriction alleviation protein
MTTDDKDLAPCPFCASQQVTTSPCQNITDDERPEITWAAICKACGARVDRDSEAEAIAAWNTRPEAADRIEQLSLGGWMPIESAPKDGSKFLAWGYMHDDGGPREPDGQSFMGEMPMLQIARFVEGYTGFVSDGLGSVDGLTHWQPLPSPPALQSLQVGGE